MEPSKIYILSDPHLGCNFPWRRDRYNLSTRAWDLMATFEGICEYIIAQQDSCLILIAGDFLDGMAINHTAERYLHQYIFPKLRAAHIGVIIIGGNHDSHPDLSHGCTLDNFDYQLEQNCIVLRDMCALSPIYTEDSFLMLGPDKRSKINPWFRKYVMPFLQHWKIGFAFLPFLPADSIAAMYVKPSVEKSVWESMGAFTNEHAQRYLREQALPKLIAHLDHCDRRILLGHYRLAGSKIRSYLPASFGTDEITFSQDMIFPDTFDAVLFGHIHIPQHMFGYDHVWQLGSTDRVHFDETRDHKTFMTYEPATNQLISISLDADATHPDLPHARNMIQEVIRVPPGTADPFTCILDRVRALGDLTETLSQFKIQITPSDAAPMDVNKLQEALQELTWFADVQYLSAPEVRCEGSDIADAPVEGANLSTILDEYLERFRDRPQYELIQSQAHAIFTEALEKEIKD